MVVDSHNMKKVLEGFALQCREALDLPKGMTVPSNITHIVCVGVGGSAIAGDILKAVMKDSPVSVDVVRSYELPKHVGEKTLVFSLSHSGKTEETVDATEEALRRNATVVGISTGGHIAGMCTKFIRIPGKMQPRCALGYLFFTMLGVCHNAGFIEVTNKELNDLLAVIGQTSPVQKRAQQLVKTIRDKTPLFYSSEALRPVAMRAKTQVNENTKSPAFFNTFSEMNHNEICGYANMRRAEYCPILIRDHKDDERIKKRMDVFKEILESHNVEVEEVYVKGTSILSRLFSGIQLVDWVSYELAMDKRVDPTPIPLIDELKKRMRE